VLASGTGDISAELARDHLHVLGAGWASDCEACRDLQSLTTPGTRHRLPELAGPGPGNLATARAGDLRDWDRRRRHEQSFPGAGLSGVSRKRGYPQCRLPALRGRLKCSKLARSSLAFRPRRTRIVSEADFLL